MKSKGNEAMVEEAEEQGITPTLRFPEFEDAGAWKPYFGDTLFDQISNKEHDSKLPILAITQEQGAIPRHMIDYHVSVTDKSIESYKVVEVGDFIISLRSFQGGIEYSEYKGICSPAYVILRTKRNDNKTYFKHFFKTQRFIGLLTKNLEGLRDGKMISYKQFSELQIPTPSPEEQQKIADCLSSLDELITAHTQKLDKLKEHKKGLMQQLFPVEGEMVPKLRFPEFRDAGEWKIQEISRYLREYSVRVSAKTNLPIYSSTRSGLKSQKDYYDGRELVNESEYGVVPISYFVYRHMSDDGTFKFNINQTGGSIAVSKEYPVFSTMNLDSYFLLQILNNGEDFRKFAISQKKGGTRTRLYFSTLCSWKTLLPEIYEQSKIAECLSLIDALISEQSQKIEILKAHKRGLMQQLFPFAVEE